MRIIKSISLIVTFSMALLLGASFGFRRIHAATIRNANRSMSMASDKIKDTVNAAIKNNKVMVFSKSYCPYCTRTKDSLKKLGLDMKVFELDVSLILLSSTVVATYDSYIAHEVNIFTILF